MIIDSVIEANVHGWGTFPTQDKKPPKGCSWKTREPSAFVHEDEYRGQYAIVLRPEDLIIDIDPRNFPTGRNTWKEFKITHGLELIDTTTYVVKTGGGGYHVYLTKPADVAVKKHFTEWPGLDFLTGDKGAYVIGSGSKHESGGEYKRVRGSLANVMPAPEVLLTIIKKEAKHDEDTKKTLDFSDDIQNTARYTEYLIERAPIAVEGNAGDQTTFKVACRGRDYRLSQERTLELMLTHYNSRCTPAWLPEELADKVRNAYKYNAEPVGKNDPAMAFGEVDEGAAVTEGLYDPPVEKKQDWKMDAAGNPKPTLNNAIGYISTHPEVYECLRYSELSNDIEVFGELPWHNRRAGKRWSDEDTIHLKYYLATITKTEFSTPIVMEAAYIVAARNMYHPVREYLAHLTWDGRKRLDTWLTDYCGVQNEEYSRMIGRKTLIAAVTRAFKPGCEFHHVLVLEGPQGIGKSRAVAALGGEWFSDFHIDPANKDTVDAMRGKWILEIPEMESIRGKKDMQLLKAFITRREDRVRLAYARNTKDLPRRGIFIGTFNPDGIGYLTDSTGNRRFWPVLCLTPIDVAGITKDRDQLFAEAVVAYKNNEPIHLTDDKIRKEAEAQAEDRVEVDPWVEVVAHWSSNAGKDVDTVSTADIFENVLHGAIKNISRIDQIRIGKALTLIGWYKKRTASGFIYYRNSRDAERFPPVIPADVFTFGVLE